MYESHFGMTGQPFRLSPDPAFYFASQGHHHTVEQLRRAVAADCGVMLITGEIGAGKTTLVKTVVGELGAGSVDIATLYSTQLSGHELIVAALIAFGVSTTLLAHASPVSVLLRFLFNLDKSNRRAVLIIDEAQNLHPDAFVKLAAVASRKQPRPVPLQLILVGQPELRQKIAARELAPLRHAITSTCDLGPLKHEEVGDYVFHRLRKAGWTGSPGFDADAFSEIFRWTRGIPRRINVLCSRLLVAQFLAAADRIDADTVRRAGLDLQTEFGQADAEPSEAVPLLSAQDRIAGEPASIRRPPVELRAPEGDLGSILCLVASQEDHVKAAVLLRAFAGQPGLPPARLLCIYANDALAMTRPLFPADVLRQAIQLQIRSERTKTGAVTLLAALERVFEQHAPSAIVIFDGDASAHAAASIASAKAIPVWQADAGRRAGDGAGTSLRTDADSVRAHADRLSDVLFTADAEASQVLANENHPSDRVHCVGSLLADAVRLTVALPEWLPGGQLNTRLQNRLLVERCGYAMLVLSDPTEMADRRTLRDLLEMFKRLSRDLLLLWPMNEHLADHLARHRLADYVDGSRILGVRSYLYPEYLHWLRGASCVLTDAGAVQEEATVLRIPCLTVATTATRRVTVTEGSNTVIGCNPSRATQLIWECIYGGGKRGINAAVWGADAARTMAVQIASQLSPASR